MEFRWRRAAAAAAAAVTCMVAVGTLLASWQLGGGEGRGQPSERVLRGGAAGGSELLGDTGAVAIALDRVSLALRRIKGLSARRGGATTTSLQTATGVQGDDGHGTGSQVGQRGKFGWGDTNMVTGVTRIDCGDSVANGGNGHATIINRFHGQAGRGALPTPPPFHPI